MLIKLQYSGICIPDMYMEHYTVQLACAALTQANPNSGFCGVDINDANIVKSSRCGLGPSLNNKAYDRVQISS